MQKKLAGLCCCLCLWIKEEAKQHFWYWVLTHSCSGKVWILLLSLICDFLWQKSAKSRLFLASSVIPQTQLQHMWYSATSPASTDRTKLCWLTKYATIALWRLVTVMPICDAWLTSQNRKLMTDSWHLLCQHLCGNLQSLNQVHDFCSAMRTRLVFSPRLSSICFGHCSVKNYLRVESTPSSHVF